MRINTYDIDGVIYMGPNHSGLKPEKDDIIITGRSIEEMTDTVKFLHSRDIHNVVYFNDRSFDEKTRETSGKHKADVLNELLYQGIDIGIHFEDDPIQAEIIKKEVPSVTVVILQHDLVTKENFRHEFND